MGYRTRGRHRGQRGQAAVEAALTLPLTIFLMLGTLQLFLVLQGRIMAEYAAFRAVRSGSVNHGNCTAMTHAAILALLPTFDSFLGADGTGSPGQRLAQSFDTYKDNQYRRRRGRGRGGGNQSQGPLVWIIRESPLRGDVPNPEDSNFDQPDSPNRRLEVRLVYWYPLRIPFADWVISRMVLARWGWRDYEAQNPLLLTERARWGATAISNLEEQIRVEVLRRLARRQYVLPIHASASLRMMTPVRFRFFQSQNCSPAPEAL
jgi:hypothetical protein